MMRETTVKKMLLGYLVGKDKVKVNLLQYAHDAIFMEEMFLNNMMVH